MGISSSGDESQIKSKWIADCHFLRILMGLLFVFATQSNQQIPWFGKVTRRLKPSNSGCKWLKPAENTFTWRQWFFFQATFSRLTQYPFPVILECISYENFVKLLDIPSISRIFFIDFFGGFFALWPNGETRSRAVVLQTTVMFEKLKWVWFVLAN